MIEKMRKYSYLIYHREYEDFLRTVQDVGVVHIAERVNPREAKDLQDLQGERVELANLSRRLRGMVSSTPLSEGTESDIEPLAGDVASAVAALARYDELQAELRAQREQAQALAPWGDYDLSLVERLRSAGYRLGYYTMNAQAFTDEYAEQNDAVAVSRAGMVQYFVRVEAEGSASAPDAERHTAPERIVAEVEQECTATTIELSRLMTSIDRAIPQWLTAIDEHDRALATQYSFGAARLQAVPQASDTLVFLEGWVPERRAEEMEQALGSTGFYYRQSEIEDEDNVPIALRNGSFSRLFEPITRMFSLPNYSEIDQTVLFAPFFMLFFGLCLGDAGYGLILLIAATYFRFRAKEGEDTSIHRLLQWLGGAAFVVGMATGSLFGVTLGYAMDKEYLFSQDNLMIFSVIIGLVQILFAKGVAAYKTKVQRGIKYALAPMAWLIILLGLIAMYGLPAADIALPQSVEYILYGIVGVSVLVAFLYNTPGKNPLLNVGSGLWTAYNVASGMLGDTLSYIRLFAIGLTGAILGGVFNTLAIEQTEGLNIFIRIPVVLIILLAGHGINIAIALIGAFVHPLRLTFVEYYKNSEFEGGGKPYNPLSKE